jgi:hypothetical protein
LRHRQVKKYRWPMTVAKSLVRALALVVVGLASSGFGGLERSFAPKAKLWAKWQTHDAVATTSVDHASWQNFLDRYVRIDESGVARVAYGRVTSDDRDRLGDYIARLSAITVTALAPAEQTALWINLYNALTVDVVLDHYPVASILDIDISPGLFADGPWDKKLVAVEAERVSLNDIEHRILRPVFGDNRIHFAVNCASVGCPNLAPRAYLAATLDADLDTATRTYVNHPRGARVDGAGLTVSKIFDWYVTDFGGTEESVIRFLADHAAAPLAAALERRAGHLESAYDWALNDDPPTAAASGR